MVTCLGCKEGVKAIDNLLMSDKIQDTLGKVVLSVCGIAEKFIVHEPLHCQDYLDGIGRLFYSELATSVLGPSRVCNEMFGFCSEPVITEIETKTAVSDILKNKPAQIQDDNFVNNLYAGLAGGSGETLKAIHLSDVHLDFNYLIGSESNCADTLQGCCRAESGMTSGNTAAREWGEYTCDTPTKTFDNILDQIVSINPDVLFWTGDNSPHNTATNTLEESTDYTIKTTQMI